MKNTRLKLVALSLVCSLVACGGGGGSSNKVAAAADGSGPATVSLQASATLISAGGSVTLTWSSNRASSCSASGGWSGSKSTSGSQTVGPINQDTTYTLSCSGAGGGGLGQVTVRVNSGNGVQVSLTADPDQVVANASSTLNWTSANASSCTAAGGWSGSKALSGSYVTGGLTQTTSYRLTCSGPSGSALAMVTVEVIDKILRWQAPTENVDGSPLTDLAGFKIYWGTQSRNYGTPITINSPTTTQWESTTGPGRFYFALTAFDVDGNESAYSNEVLKTIPQ